MNPKIIHEEKEFLILAKPAGLLMHGLPNKTVAEPTLADWLRIHFPETKKVGDDPDLRPGIVHRLDRDTSGVIVVARTQTSFEYLKSLFQSRAVTKRYLALARGHVALDRDLIRKPIGVKPGTTQRSVRSTKDVKEAMTEYRVLERLVRDEAAPVDPAFKSTLLEVTPRTGRTHQIRVHLTFIGHPVLGDALYGPKKQPEWVSRLMLHAHTLEFPRKDGTAVSFTAPPDAQFAAVLREAGSGEW